MTLLEAVATSKPFKRAVSEDDFMTYEEHLDAGGFSRTDVLASDYEVMLERSVEITTTLLHSAWESARAGSLRIQPAGTSEFYKKLATSLGLG